MIGALDLAKYYLKLADDDSGELLSNLKLQKLLYYAQGFHLACFGAPLFRDSIEAWTHGPVVPTVYHEYKHNGSCGIQPPEENVKLNVNDDALEVINDVYYGFGQFSAWKLREMTHREPPWADTLNGCGISQGVMKEYFATQIVEEDG